MYRRPTPKQRHSDDNLDSHLDTSMPTEKGFSSTMPSLQRTNPQLWLSAASSPRVFFIVLIIVVLVLISRSISPSDPYGSHHTHKIHRVELSPRDYLNESDTNPAPFEFCPHYGPGDALAAKYGAVNLAKSKVFMGSGARVQRVIHRALAGLPITMSVLGGSVSACHGAGDNPISPNCYPSRFFEWWNSVFPHPASELTNGAMRRTNSAYFSFCSAHHLPDNTDLVIIEFDTEDDYDPTTIEDYDLLIRSLLSRTDQPAVLMLGSFSPQVIDLHGYADASSLHNIVAQYYDIPHVSTKGLVFSEFMNNPAVRQPSGAASSPSYWVDPLLHNSRGHELLSDVLINYFQEMTCKGWDTALGRGWEVPLAAAEAKDAPGAAGLFGGQGARKGGGPAAGKANDQSTSSTYAALRIPPIRINDNLKNMATFREPKPFCASANDLLNPLPLSIFTGSGWHVHNPSPSNSGSPDLAGALGYYWYSTIPTSRLRIPSRFGSGDVGIYYLLEPKEQFATTGPPGVLCWVDDNMAGAAEISGAGDVSVATPALVMIDRGVSSGYHTVDCQLMGDEGQSSPPFKILGVFAT